MPAYAARLTHFYFLKNEIVVGIADKLREVTEWVARHLKQQVLLTKAEETYERELVGSEKGFGPKYGSTLAIINDLGNLYRSQGKLDDTEVLKRASFCYEETLGPEHPKTLGLKRNLSIFQCSQSSMRSVRQSNFGRQQPFSKSSIYSSCSVLDPLKHLNLSEDLRHPISRYFAIFLQSLTYPAIRRY